MIETRAAIVYQVLAKAIYLRPYSVKHSSKGRYYGHNLYDPGELILMYTTRQVINVHLFVTADFISRTRQLAALYCDITLMFQRKHFSAQLNTYLEWYLICLACQFFLIHHMYTLS